MNREAEFNLISGKTKPEFGNKEHIKLLEKYTRLQEEFKEGKCIDELNLSALISINFDCCKCGYPVEADFEADENRYVGDHEVISELSYQVFKCHSCKQNYRFDGEAVYLHKIKS